ncbi:SAV_915 family protein [Streptomyces radicis]|uniref:SseB family protein n=1 Tax=Streptomyces radicis TaxID=1750517 RepID=A0A3A9WBA8_9ACTN|nr:SAV_915 family protein [Streptomyces radicis]RKN04886.1 hypothetical protein D7319_27195 [Streptomyces radicis]RKN25396.1 hypothetical protein D7318_09355 [Streptomyces radicis]
MNDLDVNDDEPADHGAHAWPYYVPVRPGPSGFSTVRTFRTPLGERTVAAFTSAERLTAALGPWQRWATLGEDALRALVAPLGVRRLTIDPQLSAPAVRDEPRTAVAA